MANKSQLDYILQCIAYIDGGNYGGYLKSIEKWNEWRQFHPNILPDLSNANLSKARLNGIDLTGANLSRADLSGAALYGCYLSGADLTGANFVKADISYCHLDEAILHEADLRCASLSSNYLENTDLSKADLRGIKPVGGINLSEANTKGARLETEPTHSTTTQYSEARSSIQRGSERHR